MSFDYGRKRSLEEAVAATDSYVEPRDCFVTYVNNKFGWQSFSTTGDTPCAHYVSHQLELRPTSGFKCKAGYLLRVRELVDVLGSPVAIGDVQAGDVWARMKGATAVGGREPSSHCGIVSAVTRPEGGSPDILIRHCSSAQRMVALNDWKKHFAGGGQFFRVPSSMSSTQAMANLQRLVRGFSYRQQPVSGGSAPF